MTVGELIDNLLPALAKLKVSYSTLDAVQIVTDHLTTRLLVAGSDLLKETATLQTVANAATITLPDTWIGFPADPRVNVADAAGCSDPLTVLPEEEYGSYFAPGKPRFFELTRTALTLFPTPDAVYTVTIRANIRPTRPDSLDDSLPFNGVLDHVYKALVPRAAVAGAEGLVNQQTEAYLLTNCDRLVINRKPANIRWRYPR